MELSATSTESSPTLTTKNNPYRFPPDLFSAENIELFEEVLTKKSLQSIQHVMTNKPVKLFTTDQQLYVMTRCYYSYGKNFVIPAARLIILMCKYINNLLRFNVMDKILTNSRPDNINHYADVLAAPGSGILLKNITIAMKDCRMTPIKFARAITEIYEKRAHSLGFDTVPVFEDLEPEYRKFMQHNELFHCPNFSSSQAIEVYLDNIQKLNSDSDEVRLSFYMNLPTPPMDAHIANDLLFLAAAWNMMYNFKLETERLYMLASTEAISFAEIFLLSVKQNYNLSQKYTEYLKSLHILNYLHISCKHKARTFRALIKILLDAIKEVLEHAEIQISPSLIKACYVNLQRQCLDSQPPESRLSLFIPGKEDTDFTNTAMPKIFTVSQFNNILEDPDYCIIPERRVQLCPKDTYGPLTYHEILTNNHGEINWYLRSITTWQWIPYVLALARRKSQDFMKLFKSWKYSLYTIVESKSMDYEPYESPSSPDSDELLVDDNVIMDDPEEVEDDVEEEEEEEAEEESDEDNNEGNDGNDNTNTKDKSDSDKTIDDDEEKTDEDKDNEDTDEDEDDDEDDKKDDDKDNKGDKKKDDNNKPDDPGEGSSTGRRNSRYYRKNYKEDSDSNSNASDDDYRPPYQRKKYYSKRIENINPLHLANVQIAHTKKHNNRKSNVNAKTDIHPLKTASIQNVHKTNHSNQESKIKTTTNTKVKLAKDRSTRTTKHNQKYNEIEATNDNTQNPKNTHRTKSTKTDQQNIIQPNTTNSKTAKANKAKRSKRVSEVSNNDHQDLKCKKALHTTGDKIYITNVTSNPDKNQGFIQKLKYTQSLKMLEELTTSDKEETQKPNELMFYV